MSLGVHHKVADPHCPAAQIVVVGSAAEEDIYHQPHDPGLGLLRDGTRFLTRKVLGGSEGVSKHVTYEENVG